jgi:predicted MFS family arabinose efflux permease
VGVDPVVFRSGFSQGVIMIRERALKVALMLVGLLFVAGVYPLLRMQTNPGEQMLGIVYVTLGVFLLLAFRNPSANRSLISFTAWSSFAHAGTMAMQSFRDLIPREDLLRAVLPLFVIGLILIVLSPAKVRASVS